MTAFKNSMAISFAIISRALAVLVAEFGSARNWRSTSFSSLTPIMKKHKRTAVDFLCFDVTVRLNKLIISCSAKKSSRYFELSLIIRMIDLLIGI